MITRRMLRIYFAIAVTLFSALILEILPLPTWFLWCRPEWMLLVILFWVLFYPSWVSVGIAWCVGFTLDIFTSTLLGEHALAMTVVAYLLYRLHRQVRLFPLWQQSLLIAILVTLYQTIIFIIQGLIGQAPLTWWYWSSVWVSMLLWPCVVFLLRGWCEKWRLNT